ncbi:hypothetical protein [Devosia sp.]|uniref:hypothetical protein n=1 Tax=Devosia sp. TaxID=1871048 RepID=UPI003267DE52
MLMVLLMIVTVINVVVAAGFSLAGVFFPGFIVKDGEDSHTARVFALYGVARSVPLLVVVLWAVFKGSMPGLIWLGALAEIIQLVDAAVGTQTGDKIKIYGSLGLGIAQLAIVVLAVWFGY